MIPAPQSGPSPADAAGRVPTLLGSGRTALAALGVIFAANFLSYLDRMLVSALEEPLRQSFLLKAEGFGLLWTLFTIGYMVFAMPIGFLADRLNRPRILAACIVIWSVATVATGLARTTPVLYVARFLIGVGEAGCLIVGQSLLVDFFAREVRGRCLSIFHLAVPLGGTGAFILAGALGSWLDWRELFYIAGTPGLLVAALLLLLRDPPRGGASAAASTRKAGLKDYLQLFRTRTLLLIILGQAFAVIMLVCLIHFGVGFFTQFRGMYANQARLALGLMALVSGALGNAAGGFFGDRLSRRFQGAYAMLAGIGYGCALPLLLLGFHAATPAVFLPALATGSFFLFMCMPAVNAQIANVTHPAQRATAWSLAVFVLHLLGDTTAPYFFGKAEGALGSRLDAFFYFSFTLAAASVCCLMASRTAPRDLERLRVRIAAETPASGVV